MVVNQQVISDFADAVKISSQIQVIEEGTQITDDGIYLEIERKPLRVTIRVGYSSNITMGPMSTDGDVVVDWGDGTTSIINNPTDYIEHRYPNTLTSYTITFNGKVTGLGQMFFAQANGNFSVTSIYIPDSVVTIGSDCFNSCIDLISIVIPDSVVTIGNTCFNRCTGLTSVVIPASVESIGYSCFSDCYNLIDYQLYWTGNNIIRYDPNIMKTNNGTIFTIPVGETANYVAKGYPSAELQERSE